LLSAGFLNLGFAQLVVLQRAVRLARSHSFEQPACVLPSLHLQAQTAECNPLRRLGGVSEKAAAARRSAATVSRAQRRKKNPRSDERAKPMAALLCRPEKKPMVRAAKNFLLLK